ncbi:TNFAIP3-interacting protein 3 isoform X1 [Oryctolagus cuniculus]|uniref:TNFAIP3-interacting protein 3 isoform X1 n=1 Tax=Oryctolagus cuniculus TaxID=9986 RepID=UPI002230A670|nr:TNFAIP3-interacting protein 3 isoform X1 [Oryctolagus cuniculus]
MELDNEIRDLIERSAPDPKGVTPEATPHHRNPCSPKIPGNTVSMAHSVQGTPRRSAAEVSTEQAECAQSSRKNLTNSLEQKIRCLEKQRKELLEVNWQWDQQFRSMKELYEQKKENERLAEELHELKKENKLLKEKIVLVTKKKEHYECEIKRLNKALQDALKIEYSSVSEDYLRKSKVECSHEEMRTELEVLKQQVRIYEEDFKKERSDRERLNQEKEELQQINQTSQSQLSRLNSQIKACQMEKEKLEKQLKQMHFPTCNCGLVFHLRDPWVPTVPGAVQDQQEHPPDYQWHAFEQLPPDVQHKANGSSSEKRVNQ